MPENCQKIIDSDETAEFIVLTYDMTTELLNLFQGECFQRLSSRYFTIYTPTERLRDIPLKSYYYGLFPKLYGETSTTALEVSGISKLTTQPLPGLRGQGVIIGIADSGIDYTHPAFLDSAGKTRILYLWDQTLSDGPAPEGISYGTEYTEDDINRALASDDPFSIVKTTDATGHGTHIAGAAAGTENLTYDFCGAAPEAKFVIVKLKPASSFLRNYYFISADVPAYQENDIMLAINYIRLKAINRNHPLSIPFGLGGGLGGHSGFSALDFSVDSATYYPGACICVPTGNEGLSGQHFQGYVRTSSTPVPMELYIASAVSGIAMEIWGQNPSTLSISVESPTGEVISRIPAKLGQIEEYKFLFEGAKISVYYELVESFAGDEVIFIRLSAPTEGIWKFFLYSDMDDVTFHAYLPGSSLIGTKSYFLKPEPDGTLTDPSGSEDAISVSGYDAVSGAFYLDSGRGFTRLDRYKPDLCAPCTNITVPNLRGGYELRSGTSLAAAITAGACAQILTWGITLGNYPYLTANNIKTYLIRGAIRKSGISYPSRQWGYGTLDVYHAFEVLRRGGNI